jgi:secreted PhoX family phosphatase
MKTSLLVFTLFAFSSFICIPLCRAQSIGTFNSVEPTAQTQNLVIPSTHTFQRIIRSGSPLSSGGTLGSNLDFTGYVPIAGSSTNGYLSISSETAPAECAILSMSFNNGSNLWNITNSGKVDFPVSDIGYCAAFCSGTVTPRNTIMVCEEVAPAGDSNGDGYDDLGWIIEIDPATRTVINQDAAGGVDKLWAMGRQVHENVAIKGDQSVAYWGADNITNGFIYKFVPTAPGNFSAGSLYVLESTSSLGSGTWKQIRNTTKPERNNTIAESVAAGAYNFQRIEDVEIGPDGKIYFASTTNGRVFRFIDMGTTVSNLEVYVENTTYDVDGPGSFAAVKFEWPDNLAFDGEGNLWVLQDGGDNHIWVVSPAHTTAAPSIKVFGNTPAGSEPTGITFSPDYRFMFMSLQNPSSSNTAGQLDAASDNVIFDANTTLVIARKGNLGASILPITHIKMNLLQKNNGIEINWASAKSNDPAAFDIERSTNGLNFTKIGSVSSSPASNNSYTYLDRNVPTVDNIYYRIVHCNLNSLCIYSDIKSLKINNSTSLIKAYALSPGNVIRVTYNAKNASEVLMHVYSNNGSEVYREKRKVTQGINDFNITIDNLPSGIYILKMNEGGNIDSRSFVK